MDFQATLTGSQLPFLLVDKALLYVIILGSKRKISTKEGEKRETGRERRENERDKEAFASLHLLLSSFFFYFFLVQSIILTEVLFPKLLSKA